jgi:hypothetical protein
MEHLVGSCYTVQYTCIYAQILPQDSLTNLPTQQAQVCNQTLRDTPFFSSRVHRNLDAAAKDALLT